MADASARRDARRRRILDNSENRLQKITGKVEGSIKNLHKEKIDGNKIYANTGDKNNSICSKSILIPENEAILEEKHKDFIERDNYCDLGELDFSNTKMNTLHCYQNDFHYENLNPHHASNKNIKTHDNVDLNKNINLNQQLQPISYFALPNLLFSPLFTILAAAIMNILLIFDANFSLYKGIIIPYVMMVSARLSLRSCSEDTQNSSMLIAALILFNIKPEIVQKTKKTFTLFNSFSRDFTLYLISFSLLNWILSHCCIDLSRLQFF